MPEDYPPIPPKTAKNQYVKPIFLCAMQQRHFAEKNRRFAMRWDDDKSREIQSPI
jgi:hypothetical protein